MSLGSAEPRATATNKRRAALGSKTFTSSLACSQTSCPDQIQLAVGPCIVGEHGPTVSNSTSPSVPILRYDYRHVGVSKSATGCNRKLLRHMFHDNNW